MTALLPFLLVVLQTSPPVPEETLRTVECPEGRIDRIFVDNHSIFDPSSLPEDGRIRWAYDLANSLHMRTREEFIRDQLLVSEGDCYDPLLVDESARILREFRFIAGADAYGVHQPDGTRHVVVDTHDEWTTKLGLSVRFDEGLQFEGAFLVEENLLGRGIALGTFFTKRDERRELGAFAEVPRLRGSSWDGRVAVAATRIGERLEQEFVHPFRGEHPGVGFRQALSHHRDLFSYVLPPDHEFSHVVVPVQEERGEVALARRSGQRGDFRVLGGGISYERVDPAGLESVELVRDERYGSRLPAPPAVTDPLRPQLRTRKAFRMNVIGGVRRIRFVERRGLDAVRGLQDLPLGREVLLTVGRSMGPTGRDLPPDFLARLNSFRGLEMGQDALAFFSLSAEGRLREGSGASASRWRDILAETRAVTYWQPSGVGGPTLVLHAQGQGGWHTDAPFQLNLGGPDGVRGYSETDLPGGRRAIVSAESRWPLDAPFSEVLDLGTTLFVDVGRIWAGDAPFGSDSGWRTAAGAGLRVGFPAGSSRVIRIDVALPTDPGVPRRPILRISAREWLGLLGDTRNLQLLRSRRSGITTDFTGVARDRRPLP